MKLRMILVLAAAIGIGSVYTEAKADRGSTGTGTRDGGNIPDWQELVPAEIKWVDILTMWASEYRPESCDDDLRRQGFSRREVRSMRQNGFPTYERITTHHAESSTVEIFHRSHRSGRVSGTSLGTDPRCGEEVVTSTLYLNGEEATTETLVRRLEEVFLLLVSQVRLDATETWLPPFDLIAFVTRTFTSRRHGQQFYREHSGGLSRIFDPSFLGGLMDDHASETMTRIRAIAARAVDGNRQCVPSAFGQFRSLVRHTLTSATNPLSPRFRTAAMATLRDLNVDDTKRDTIERVLSSALSTYPESRPNIFSLQNEIATLSTQLHSLCEGTL